jgi:8-oxo-dGTP pyrophosphatase MutT (NUDIX family)
MLLEEARRRLFPFPHPLPPPPRVLEPRVLIGLGTVPGVPHPPPGPVRRGAVLILLYPAPSGEALVALTERPSGDLRHPGEVSLPGGAVEEADTSDTAAALREAAEEIGLDPAEAGVEVAGELDPVDVRVSGFRLVPIVALAARQPRFRPDPREVASLLEAPLAAFLPGAPIEIVEEERAGRRLTYGAFPVGGHRVWGATGRILGQLGAVLSREASSRRSAGEVPPTRARRSG